ncbi:LysR family transcriptional regulator [Ideonella livida]|uniref:LysR family transcriptional regulator n=1 Tax=Ideonella livida TaxID=2707176 RepID=A0A7C9PJY5_9BURK|nr:LysR family transcriptional regulator [Ideonella livida]NDY93896.1 LysR family transcriptional regulator [Ideonella livida]
MTLGPAPLAIAHPPVLDPRWALFLQVAQAGSLSKAALALDQPQSLVSRQITALEQACGERLFHRTGRGVVLTALGEQLLSRVERLQREADGLADEIRNARGTPSGEVRVGLLPSAVRRFGGPLAKAVRQQLPGVRLHLAEGASTPLEELLQLGRLDMAVVLREADDATEALHAGVAPPAPGEEPVLATLALQLTGPCGDPLLASGQVPLAALAGVPLVVPARPHLLRARLDALAQHHGLDLRVALEADSVQLQLEVVAAGGGYAIASALPGQADARLAWARIVQPTLIRRVVLAESLRRPQTGATRAVRRLLCALAEP